MTATAQPTNPEPYGAAAVRDVCWGLLFHMLGLPQQSKVHFSNLEASSTANELITLADRVMEYSKLTESGPTEDPTIPTRLSLHEAIAINVDHILHPTEGSSGVHLHRESKRCYRHRKALDGPKSGYSRDPFKTIAGRHKASVALAAILYIVRAHSLFYCRSRSDRNFNVAKVALNDLFQANQLACRLYYSLTECHFKSFTQDSYLESVRRGPELRRPPCDSPYFIWSALQLVEIQRGNIYRSVEYLEEAARYYRHAEKRFHLVRGFPFSPAGKPNTESATPSRGGGGSDAWLLTPTLIRMLYAYSKVLFDHGLFVESMLRQVYCLALLSQLGKIELDESPSKEVDLEKVTKGLRSLEVIRRESVWNKELIQQLFGYTELEEETDRVPAAPLSVLLEKPFVRGLEGPTAGLATDLYTRLGFTLFILRRGHQRLFGAWSDERLEAAAQSTAKFFSWLRQFFEINTHLQCKQPPLARYCLSIIRQNTKGDTGAGDGAQYGTPVFRESVERELAHRLRGALNPPPNFQSSLSESSFYRSLLDITTQNMLNVVTIPRRVQSFFLRMGYKERRTRGDLSGDRVSDSLTRKALPEPTTTAHRMRDKLVVLRRWQSFNPKIPRPEGRTVRGGGYFLLWHGKGIVIDPGYDFIQNFYDEGFSLDDINAVVVTHSHPDHEDDLSTLSTLVREWNEYHEQMGSNPARRLKLDLFLNESAHLKFSGWLKASSSGVARVIPLPLVVWNIGSNDPSEAIRGDNVVLDLRREYCLELEVVPAWHDDVIGKTAAIGLSFHLFESPGDEEPVGKLGYTGDTGAYPWSDEARYEGQAQKRVEDQYKECDVLVAHLGDVRLRELFTILGREKNKSGLQTCVNSLLENWFCTGKEPTLCDDLITKERVAEFFKLLVTLHIAPTPALETVLRTTSGGPVTVATALGRFINGEPIGAEVTEGNPDLIGLLISLASRVPEESRGTVEQSLRRHLGLIETVDGTCKESHAAYALLVFLCSFSLASWKYHYHLGVSGIYRLHQAMLAHANRSGGRTRRKGPRVFVVGELPEELASYRHHVARLLNNTQGNGFGAKRKIHALTGDIGLHIALDRQTEAGKPACLDPKIRCTYCNYNNETVLRKENYHRPRNILETPLKRLDSALIYLCTEHDHHPENEERPFDFLSRPSIRVI